MVAHPSCQHLAVSGSKHFWRKQKEQKESLDFVRMLMNCNIPRWAIENPISVISSAIRPPDQIIQPWEFGDSFQNLNRPRLLIRVNFIFLLVARSCLFGIHKQRAEKYAAKVFQASVMQSAGNGEMRQTSRYLLSN